MAVDEVGHHRTMTKLERTLGFKDLTFLVVGAVIGSGIFLVPGAVLRSTQEWAGLALVVWLAGGILSLLGALTYGELTAMHPNAGGLYVYIRDCFGKLPAFLYGWTLFLVIGNGAIATLGVAFSTYLNEVVPISILARKIVAILMIVVLTIVNVRGTRQSADLQNVTTMIKVAAILLMSAVLLSLGNFSQVFTGSFWPSQFTWSLAAGCGVAMVGVLWAYEGWQFVTFSAGETKEPQKDFPRAFFIGVMTLVLVYILANLSYIAALGPAGAAATDSIGAVAVSRTVGPWAAKLVTIPILISIFSAANSIPLTVPRVFYAMALDGLFFRKMGEVHERFHTPAFAVIIGSAWGILLTLTGTFEQLFTYVVFGGWIFYTLAAASIFVYRKRMPDALRPYKVPGYPWTPLLFVAAGTALVLNTIVSQPREALIGSAIVLSGIPAYFFWHARGKAQATKSRGTQS